MLVLLLGMVMPLVVRGLRVGGKKARASDERSRTFSSQEAPKAVEEPSLITQINL